MWSNRISSSLEQGDAEPEVKEVGVQLEQADVSGVGVWDRQWPHATQMPGKPTARGLQPGVFKR